MISLLKLYKPHQTYIVTTRVLSGLKFWRRDFSSQEMTRNNSTNEQNTTDSKSGEESRGGHESREDDEEVSGESWQQDASDDPLYPNHIESSCLQKGLLAVGSAYMSITRPWRDDMIGVLGEVTGVPALRYIHNKMKNDPTGKTILRDRPRINSQTVDMQYLRSLPDHTFGNAYINFLDTNNVTPDTRYPVQFVDDEELAYVMTRYREVHDLIHTILGMPTNMLGEVSVKWVEGLQFGLPLGILGGLVGPLRLGPKHRRRYLDTHLPWALKTGWNTRFLMNVYFERHWEDSLEELRMQLNIEDIGERSADPQKNETNQKSEKSENIIKVDITFFNQ